MITDAQGRPVASDGPTGKQFNVIEVMKDNKRSWSIMIPSGHPELAADELIAVMGLLIHSLSVQQLAHMATQKVKNVMQNLKE